MNRNILTAEMPVSPAMISGEDIRSFCCTGNGEDSSYWNAQISEFTRFMRVTAVEQPRSRRVGQRNKGALF